MAIAALPTIPGGRYCYVVAGVCSDGVESFSIAGHHYSFLACNTVEIVGNDDAPEAAASVMEEGAEEEEEEKRPITTTTAAQSVQVKSWPSS